MAAGSFADYKLLVLNDQRAKWGSPTLGTGTSLTYAVVNAPLHTAGAINCIDVVPPDGLLAANDIARGAFDAQLAAAFSAWSSVADISFRRIDDVSAADIVVGAEGIPGGRAFTNVATVTPPVPVSRVAADGTQARPAAIDRSIVCLNPQQRWKIGFDGNLDVYDLRYTLMHEIGHAIGLDHPDGTQAVMDFHYTEAFSTLQPGDIAGVDLLYGARPAPSAPVAIAVVSRPSDR